MASPHALQTAIALVVVVVTSSFEMDRVAAQWVVSEEPSMSLWWGKEGGFCIRRFIAASYTEPCPAHTALPLIGSEFYDSSD